MMTMNNPLVWAFSLALRDPLYPLLRDFPDHAAGETVTGKSARKGGPKKIALSVQYRAHLALDRRCPR